MSTIDRKTILRYLINKWGSYVNDYRALSAQDRLDFMNRQGYQHFADLLAHFVAWWELGMRSIDGYRSDPDFKPPAVDVNSFNAAAVAGIRDLSEEQVIRYFEETRERFIDLVNNLSDNDFTDTRITKQLEIELVGHLAEHAIKKDPDS